MNSKSTLARNLIALVVVVLAGGGCSAGDDCNLAADHLAECLNPPGSPPTSDPGPPAKCEGVTACHAGCVNRATCDTLVKFRAGTMTAGTDEYAKCIDDCAKP